MLKTFIINEFVPNYYTSYGFECRNIYFQYYIILMKSKLKLVSGKIYAIFINLDIDIFYTLFNNFQYIYTLFLSNN